MQVFYEFNKKYDLSLALGYFDGVHKGHKKVIETAVDFAKKNGKKTGLITFLNHPCCYFLNLKPKSIIPFKDKLNFIEDLGVDYLYAINFDDKLAKISAKDYLENCLIKNFKPKAITTGFNHNFGLNKTGDSEFLKKMSKTFGYEYFEIPPQKFEDTLISSSEIRKLLMLGEIETANKMLGKNFYIEGKVVHGEGIGRTIGFKTANLNYPENIIDIKNGVYGVFINVQGTEYKGILNCGIKPTVSNKGERTLEVNIFDFDKNIYDENVKIEFIKKIRDEKKFQSIVELKEQIEKDSAKWRNS